MPPDEHDFRKALISHIQLLEAVLARIHAAKAAPPTELLNEIEAIHERVSNVCGVMKADLQRLS
jgi:hypothetical protein